MHTIIINIILLFFYEDNETSRINKIANHLCLIKL